MAEQVQWNDITKTKNGKGSGSGGKYEYLRLESGKTYRIRPVFTPVKFYKYFHSTGGGLRTAIVGDPDTCPVRDRHPELKAPSLRYAEFVIDRADEKVKILEAPQSVFRPMATHFEATGKNPGGSKDGSDWQIKVTGKKLSTNYDVIYLKETPLNDEEKALVKEALDGDKDRLEMLYKTDTPEEVEEKLFGESIADGKKSNRSASVRSQDEDLDLDGSSGEDSQNDDFDANWL